jgi:uncharacterized membrane-anchored protein YjiN (DUF445 family)
MPNCVQTFQVKQLHVKSPPSVIVKKRREESNPVQSISNVHHVLGSLCTVARVQNLVYDQGIKPVPRRQINDDYRRHKAKTANKERQDHEKRRLVLSR